jgi:hypothetical protein
MDAESDISLNLPQPNSQTSKDSSVHTEAFGFEPVDPIRNLAASKERHAYSLYSLQGKPEPPF